ncbi:uncharacterized protein LOC129566361 [Sitodiplosis mosellana]|uniref:uncharacterized protein LOC129566361 n=1 Tax=Sitodiplosis mosellana TaxID=263140 RepID=UPI002443BE2E|nr:uncharacterized protein LOC129566361 [Sitodiplosis mosellana]
MDTEQLFLISFAVMFLMVLFKMILHTIEPMPAKGQTSCKMSPVQQRKSISAAGAIDSAKISTFSAGLTESSTFSEQPGERNFTKLSVDRSPNPMANTDLKSNQRTPLKQRKVDSTKRKVDSTKRKVDSTKRKVALHRPTILISRSNDVAQVDTHLFDGNPNHVMFASAKPSVTTPKKLIPSEPSFLGQKSPQLSPFKGKAFSPSNVNKSKRLSVSEMIEGWPFKRPQQSVIKDKKLNCHQTIEKVENIVHSAKFLETSEPIQHNNADVNKENVPATAISNERYPKSMYVSPFTIVGRRPIRSKQQK